jgi:hypothetical protein
MKLSASIVSLLNPERISAGWVYMNIFTDDGSVSITLPLIKPKAQWLMIHCQYLDLYAEYCRMIAQALNLLIFRWASTPE